MYQNIKNCKNPKKSTSVWAKYVLGMEEMSIAALAFSCIKWPTNFLKQNLLFGVRVFGRRTGQICFVSVQGWPFFKKIKNFGMYKKNNYS